MSESRGIGTVASEVCPWNFSYMYFAFIHSVSQSNLYRATIINGSEAPAQND